ncbi:MAG: IS110 family transposase [Desulfobacterales bacterium]
MQNCTGIDISKKTFDVHFLYDSSDHHIDYTPENIQKTVMMFRDARPELIVMEATGGYEFPLAEELYAAGLPVVVVNPKRIRDFAKAAGQTAKTDRIDARIIARFAALMEPPVRNAQNAVSSEIRELIVRKRQITDMRTAEKNRTEHIRNDFIEQSIRTVTATLETQITAAEERIRSLIASSPELKQKTEVIQSVPGIGENTAAALISGLPEIVTMNSKEIAALTGTAPVNRDSGQFRGKRMIGGGRHEIRSLMYMPTLAAIRHNPVIRRFYQRLLSAGKIKMVAVTACMRKLLVLLNSMVAKKQTWNPESA